ncbi:MULTISPECIES: ATP-binding protein [Variovorax]|jgi:two-component system, OmpR family, sensor kinase|uniref:ATP-binding protein n=1 Tax=Variovorax TaxID=34072 RepID=UPI00086B3B8C|nr:MULTISPECIES: ATP-binding protein [Variovorax]MBN8758426.1 HAMP domain-containing protein [Variovorax sp.]ODU18901.1 MAG: hypothetical protein ABS94_02340 [Variovorax sp. SCN 67-85]ODV18620.1 MAG: hypothetical protein ABT25_28020 [Variovorax sp. SCN 67-20]OJZ05894.1 MAG: hypothetical protein BGP22_23680 [Variovorax sp. 67-131]UKI06089.1 ATP-binding protein [Variovorax paradoxus]
MNSQGTARRWPGPPLALQITGLLLACLVVAQVVTLALTVLLPPEPQRQWELGDIARVLSGRAAEGRNASLLQRSLQARAPEPKGQGWLTSERSRHDLAQLMERDETEVRLYFFTPLPFAGTTGQVADAGTAPRAGIRQASFVPTGGGFIRVQMGGPGGGMSRMPSGPAGGTAFPGGLSSPGGLGGMGGWNGSLGTSRDPGTNQGGFPQQQQQQQSQPQQAQVPGNTSGTTNAVVPDNGTTSQRLLAPTPSTSSGDLTVVPSPGALAPSVSAAPSAQASPRITTAAPDAAPPSSAASPPATANAPGLTAAPRLSPFTAPLQAAPPVIHSAPLVPTFPLAIESAPTRKAASTTTTEAPSTPAARTPAKPAQPAARAPASEPPATAVATPSRATPEAPRPSPSAPQAQPSTEPTADVERPATRGLFGLAPAPFVEGDFIAAVYTREGSWVVVQPVPESFPNAWQRRVLLWFLIAAAIVAPAGWWFSRRLVRPITGFARAADQLGRDPAAPVLALEGPAEIGRAAQAFNRMQARLRSFVDDRTVMIGAISHDLRTPLTRLRFRIEDVPDDVRAGMLEDVEEMESMIGSVLGFIRDASVVSARERMDFASLVEDVVEQAVFVGKDVLLLQRTEHAQVEVDVIGMRRVLDNLIENAVKYGNQARVRLFTDGPDVVVEISDRGPGLPPDELERVFKPFYRTPQARSSRAAGSGLGLAVCRSIARAHGGDVVLKSGSHGLLAQVRVPLALDAPRREGPLLEHSASS